jgi:hypothetical protein
MGNKLQVPKNAVKIAVGTIIWEKLKVDPNA